MLSLVQEVFAKATRLEIDTSGGIQVWHVWNPSAHKNPEARRPLVLLHGGSGSWTHWIRNVEVLSADRAVWAIDLPGFGDSDLPPEVRDVDLMFPYVVEGIRQLFGGDPINLMGFSFGGMTAGFIAAHHPELVHELMLIGIPALGMFGQSRPLRGMREDMTAQERDAVLHHNLLQLMLHKPESIDDDLAHSGSQRLARPHEASAHCAWGHSAGIAETMGLSGSQLMGRVRCSLPGALGRGEASPGGLLSGVVPHHPRCRALGHVRTRGRVQSLGPAMPATRRCVGRRVAFALCAAPALASVSNPLHA